jgi:uncharacterized protein (DUF362 family)
MAASRIASSKVGTVPERLLPSISDPRVAVAELSAISYDEIDIAAALLRSADALGWSDPVRGAFGNVVHDGAKVVLKPNFVLHRNENRKGGILPLVTHQSLIKAVAAEVLKANPAEVVVGDAPVQSCEFDALLRVTGSRAWAEDLARRDRRFRGIRDYRRTICRVVNGVRLPEEDLQPADNYVLYNLGCDSLLEPLTDDRNSFRVTCYDPRLMTKRHSPGNHQYLIAREIIDADVVINLPKLKTHKKAGITNALKNMVGINGNKEFLPHHRLGAATDGGDCYPAGSLVKHAWETVADWQNMTQSPGQARILATINAQLERMMRLQGDSTGVEGSWSGNETVPRTTLDLNRILLYGRPDQTLAETVQRRVLHVVDAVVAGQGDGPLAPEPLPLGLLLAGENAAAVDWIGAHLLGYDAWKIPLLRMAFDDFRWPIADFRPPQIDLLGDWTDVQSPADLTELARRQTVILPAGWREAKA